MAELVQRRGVARIEGMVTVVVGAGSRMAEGVLEMVRSLGSLPTSRSRIQLTFRLFVSLSNRVFIVFRYLTSSCRQED